MQTKFLITAVVISLCSSSSYASDDECRSDKDSPRSAHTFSFEEETIPDFSMNKVKPSKKVSFAVTDQKSKSSESDFDFYQLGLDPRAVSQPNKALLEYREKGTIFGAPATDYQAICLIKIITGSYPAGINVEYYRHMQSVKPNSLLVKD